MEISKARLREKHEEITKRREFATKSKDASVNYFTISLLDTPKVIVFGNTCLLSFEADSNN